MVFMFIVERLKACALIVFFMIKGYVKFKQFCYLYPNVTIGKNVKIASGSIIGLPNKNNQNLKIGDNCIIGSKTTIYSGTNIANNVLIGDHVTIKDNVTINEYSLINTGVFINSNSQMGSNVKLMEKCHVAKNCIIEDYVYVGKLVAISNENIENKNGRVIIKKGTMIEQGAKIKPNITIGEYSKVCENSVVCKNIPAYCLVKGIPAIISKIGTVVKHHE